MVLGRRPVAPDEPPPLSRLEDDPDYDRLLTIRRTLRAALADRRHAIELDSITRHLANPETGSGRGERAASLRARAEALRAVIPQPPAPPPPTDGLPPAVTQALGLLAGDRLEPALDRAGRLKLLADEIRSLEAGLTAVAVALDEIKADRSVAAARRLLPQHRSALARIYTAAANLSAAMEVERAIIVDLLNAGFDGCEWILQRPSLPSATRLGTADQYDSELNVYMRRLQQLEIKI